MAKASKKSLFSIDEKHSDMMAEFHRDETVVIPELRDEIASLKSTLQHMVLKDDNAGLID